MGMEGVVKRLRIRAELQSQCECGKWFKDVDAHVKRQRYIAIRHPLQSTCPVGVRLAEEWRAARR